MEYFVWVSKLATTNPVAYGLLNILTMAVIGVVLATAAELIFKGLRIDLGRYKKEYEEEAAQTGTQH